MLTVIKENEATVHPRSSFRKKSQDGLEEKYDLTKDSSIQKNVNQEEVVKLEDVPKQISPKGNSKDGKTREKSSDKQTKSNKDPKSSPNDEERKVDSKKITEESIPQPTMFNF